jgi:hypothetical protein
VTDHLPSQYEPTPYDLGITDDPDACWPELADRPIPFTLTPAAEALIEAEAGL